jgi:hypothetical protein
LDEKYQKATKVSLWLLGRCVYHFVYLTASFCL